MKWIKGIAVYLLNAVLFYLILVYIGDFSMRQSIVLAALIAWLALCIAIVYVALKPARRFSPYYLRVDPNWHDLLIDFKLIGKPDEWHAIRKSVQDLPSAEYRVLRSGICFMIVHQSEDFERTLIYSNNHRTFVSEVDFEEEMEPIRVDGEDEISREIGDIGKSDVRLFVRSGGDGYNLGIRVPGRWWDQVKASCPKPIKQDDDYPTGQTKLILATISYREFDLYWEPAEWSSTFYNKTSEQIRVKRNEQRAELGWKTVEHDSDLGAELGIDWPESIEHKYFNVQHRVI